MFNVETCFVLGAGISQPFGFPLGEGLKQAIIEGSSLDSEILPQLINLAKGGTYSNMVKKFIETLGNSDINTIDSFLESNDRFIDMGKFAITSIILDAESRVKEFPTNPKGNWFAWLWNEMKTPKLSDLQNNKVSFVTFNYDRLFEFRLERQIRATFSHELDTQLERTINAMLGKIVHVHGMLRIPDDPDYSVSFGCNSFKGMTGPMPADQKRELRSLFGRQVELLSRGINLVGETHEGNNKTVETAKEHVSNAQKLIFLGFSYDERNLRKLGIGQNFRPTGMKGSINPSERDIMNHPVIGSALGVKPSARDRIYKNFNGTICLDSREHNAYDFCEAYL